MRRSIRVRMALWYAAVLAVSLGGFTAIAVAYVSRATDRRIDDSLRDAAHAFVAFWTAAQTARPDQPLPPDQLVGDFRADDFELVILDESQREIASNAGTSRLPSRRLAASSDSTRGRPDLAALFREAGAGGEAIATLAGPGGQERAYAVAVTLAGRRRIVAVMQDLASQRALLRDLTEVLALLAPLALLAAFGGGLFLAGRLLRPVEEIAATADRIEAASLHERLPVAEPGDELGHLATVMNRLLGRLDDAFDQQRRFLAEAAHELRSPVAVVRGEADLALSRPDRPPAEYREALGVILDESRRVTRIVDDLFLLGRADAAGLPVEREPVDLAGLADEVVRQSARLHPATTIRCRAPGPVPCLGDRDLLSRGLRNLVENAAKYGRPGGTVDVTVSTDGATCEIAVEDDGPGIPAEDQPRIFERFFRGHNATGGTPAPASSGAGLGLAITRWIAEAHQGTLRLARSGPTGTVFVLTLPATTPHRAGT